MVFGTAYFVSIVAARRYYRDYGFNGEDVARKVSECEIYIGQPDLKAGEKLVLLDNGLRYGVDDGRKRKGAKWGKLGRNNRPI